MTAHGTEIEEVSYETDRMQFIGTGKDRRQSASHERSGDSLGGALGQRGFSA